MILTPKAKPVRIRIKSGGIEHSSLSSLRNYFDFDDVFSLCQTGSILRWLEQQNEVVVLSRLNAALAGDSNNEDKYFLKIILSFYPEAVDSGVKDIKGLILYWMKLDNYFNVSSFLDYVHDGKILRSLINKSDERYSDLFKKRLGSLLYSSGEFQEAADLGNKDALQKMKETLPSYTSNFSSEDVASFIELKQIANNNETLNPCEFTPQVRNCALLVSLIQDISSCSNDIEMLRNHLSKDERIKTKVWPNYLMPYITYTMWACRKYFSCHQMDLLAYSIDPDCTRENGYYYFFENLRENHFELSQAQTVLLKKRINYNDTLLEGISMLSINYLRNIRVENDEDFLAALDSIRSEILKD